MNAKLAVLFFGIFCFVLAIVALFKGNYSGAALMFSVCVVDFFALFTTVGKR